MSGGAGISVVVPCYNEAPRLPATIAQLTAALELISPQSWEIVIVDDASTDDTRAIADRAATTDPRVLVTWPGHTAPGGKGKGAAVRCGLLAATGEFVLVTDADLAAPPEQLAILIDHIGTAAAAVGTRLGPGAVVEPPRPWRRRLPAALFRVCTQVVGRLDTSDPQCGFKLFRREVVQPHAAALVTDGFAYEVELLLRLQAAGETIVEIPVRWTEGGDSDIRVVRDGLRMFVDVIRARRLVGTTAPRTVAWSSAAHDAGEIAVSVVMPVFNEAPIIETVVKEVRHAVLDAVADDGHGGAELIIVDDRGNDGSSALVAALAAEDERICVLVNERNLGHGPSVLRGLDRARGRWRLQLDSDGQLDVGDFATLWARRADADLVIASRVERNDPRHRMMLTRAANALVSVIVRRKVCDANAGFKLISADLYRHLRPTIAPGTFAPSLLLVIGAARAGARIAVVPVTHHARPAGESSLRLWRLLRAMAIAAAQTIGYAARPVAPYRR